MEAELQIKKAYESILANDFEQAMERFEQAIQAEPENASYHYKFSITCARSNRLDKAIYHARRAIELDSGNVTYLLHLRHLQAKKLMEAAAPFFDLTPDKLTYAIPLLKQAVLDDPLSVEAFFMLGLAHMGLHQYEEGFQAFHEVLRLDHQHELTKYLLLKGKGEDVES